MLPTKQTGPVNVILMCTLQISGLKFLREDSYVVNFDADSSFLPRKKADKCHEKKLS